MKTNMQAFVLSTLCTSLSLVSLSQEQRTFNQNASRSNHTRLMEGAGLTFSPVYATSLNNNNDSLLFRGSGAGIKLGGDYFWGKAGIGFATGFTSSSPDDNAINAFLNRNNIPTDLLDITKSNQQNMFLLIGPAIRFGNTVEMLLHAKGGLFVNNGGIVNIQQKGAQRAAYRNESTGKSVYPGFLTGLNIQYNTKSEVWSFGIGADYISTKTEVNNYDARRAGGVEALKLSKNVSDLMAGVTVRYNINSARRVLPTVNKREMATAAAGCGAVTVRTTEPDGTVSEASFACVDDAIAYQQKKVTVRGWNPEKKEGIKDEANPGNLKAQNNNTVKSNRGTEFAMAIIDADTDGDGEYESSYLSVNGEVASITIDEPGKAKMAESGGIKQTMQTQVLRKPVTNGPVKWMSPEAINGIWGDPHVDEKDGTLRLGEGAFGKVYKSKWKEAPITSKTIRCSDGSCRIITASPNDYPETTKLSLNGLSAGMPVSGAAVWFQDEQGKTYERTTDAAGNVSLNGLPPGTPLRMLVNIGVSGKEDVFISFNSNGSMNVTKARHDIALNAIRNMK